MEKILREKEIEENRKRIERINSYEKLKKL